MWRWWAAAAAVLVLASFWAWPPSRQVAPLPPVAIASVPAPPSPVPLRQTLAQKPVAAATVRAAGEFIPLPFSDQSLPLSDSTVVRMSLPVENLRLASFRVSPEVEGHTVLADVVLGMDGLPRAFRLVE